MADGKTNFLDNLTKGSSAFADISSGLGGVSSLLFGGSQQRKAARYQQKLQMELNAQQQQYARENAQTDYERQRALVRDNASLEKQGRQSAGLSTAGDFGSGSASVSPIAAPSAGSAPTMPDPNASMLAGVQTIQASANNLVNASAVNAENRLKNSQSELNETDAITRAVKNISEIRAMRAKARSDEERTKYQMMENAAMEKFGMSNAQYENEYNASQALMAASDAAVRGQWNKAQYEEKIANIENILENTKVAKQTRTNLKQTLNNLRAEYREILSRTDLNSASAEDTRSHVAVNKADAQNRRDQHQLFEGSYSDQLRRIKLDSLPKNLYDKIQLWRSDGTFEKLDGFQQLGYGIFEAMQQSGINLSDAISLLKVLKP